MEFPNLDAQAALEDGTVWTPERRYAIIPTNGRDCLWQCLDHIVPQVDRIFLIVTQVNALREIPSSYLQWTNWSAMVDTEPPLNISRWWNRGLDYIAAIQQHASLPYQVAILNDDAMVPEGWFDAVTAQMEAYQAAAGCSGWVGSTPIVHRTPGPVGLETRLQGYAFIVEGQANLRADESLHWYFTDDHIDWSARKAGGVVMVPGFYVDHQHPNGQMTPELHAQIAKDAQRFVDIWGARPW